ncbi:hypothetical protein BJ875DRAFT_382023 [Amylocarpus encephaloides]|uniref:Uncharacterized protein n=1 Tax=Amylocarpus encephaloides TaxID=45428 RepID=A0A9P7YER6_9HELO|nr:hypothetical protein BJ875DRAFT_382023 [Amylocarpus encephaloides]
MSSRSSHRSSSSSSSAASSPYGGESYVQPRVETLRCSRCAKCVEIVVSTSSDGQLRVGSNDATASGMVRFGHNLYYCERCARMVGYA